MRFPSQDMQLLNTSDEMNLRYKFLNYDVLAGVNTL